MTTTRRFGERRITAFMENENNMNQGNVMHANDGARAYGYRAALVPGVQVWGWAGPAVLQALGAEWLERGWADVSFRRPIYPGDEITARVSERDDGVCELAITNQDGAVCVSGELGLGEGPWHADFKPSANRTPEEKPDVVPELTLETAPIGQDVRAMAVPISKEDARRFAQERERDDNPLFAGEDPVLQPGWMAGRMTPLLRHNFQYDNVAIHARTQVQNLAPARAGQTITVAGHLRDAFDRKGHHYAVLDGTFVAEEGAELAHVRHTLIFHVAKRE
jgi:acyl dehydratase